jgi:ribose transport system ATP-binding protein
VIMDEPTSSLTLKEAEKLLEVVLNLKKGGVSVIFISHRLTEVEKIADRVVVLRDGKIAGTLGKKDISAPSIIGLMIGSSLNTIYRAPKNTKQDTLLELRAVCTTAYPAKSVSLTIKRGEILGLTGLIGSGRTEIARAIFGIDTLIAGQVLLDGKPIHIRTTADAMDAGLALIPEDRKQSGLLLDESIVENIALPNWPQFSRQNLVDVKKLRKHVEKQIHDFSIKAESGEAYVSSLSGGNQQKVVLAKWLPRSPSILICDEPTRGVDVGSRQEIYTKLRSVSDEGAAVLLISSDMEEVLGVSDRIAVMHEGGISGIIERKEFSERAVMELATNRNAAGGIV